jgi:hypothetical protein
MSMTAYGATQVREHARIPLIESPDPSKAKRFGLPLPKELAASKTVTLRVYLGPFRGSGEALLELGAAEIR